MKSLEDCVPIELSWWYCGSVKAFDSSLSFERNSFVALVVLVSEKLSIVEYDLKKDHTQCMVLWSSRVSTMCKPIGLDPVGYCLFVFIASLAR